MVAAGDLNFGKISIYFVKKAVKVIQRYYRYYVATKDTIKYLTDNVPEIITPEYWLQSASNLNPLDCLIWSIIEQIVERIVNVSVILTIWRNESNCAGMEKIIQKLINKFMSQLRPHL